MQNQAAGAISLTVAGVISSSRQDALDWYMISLTFVLFVGFFGCQFMHVCGMRHSVGLIVSVHDVARIVVADFAHVLMII